MKSDISILFDFLEACGPEACGHNLVELRTEQSSLIERFIEGQCNDTERYELSRFLQLHPKWIRWIAERVKIARETQAAG
jgi:hypothetical protein